MLRWAAKVAYLLANKKFTFDNQTILLGWMYFCTILKRVIYERITMKRHTGSPRSKMCSLKGQ